MIDVLSGGAGRCAELLVAEAAGVLPTDVDGTLRVIGASTEKFHHPANLAACFVSLRKRRV